MSENVLSAQSGASVLRKARDLISDQARWTTRRESRDTQGRYVNVGDDTAVCWCALGAIAKVSNMPTLSGIWCQPATRNLDVIAREIFRRDPASVNDEFGHWAVLQMFDRAIELAEASETLGTDQTGGSP